MIEFRKVRKQFQAKVALDDVTFTIPALVEREWLIAIDSADGVVGPADQTWLSSGGDVKVTGRSFVLLRSPRTSTDGAT